MSCLKDHVEVEFVLEDWVCPKCKATCEDFSPVNPNSNIFTCSRLHYDDQVECQKCGYAGVVGDVFVELQKNKVVRLIRKECKKKQINVKNLNGDIFFDRCNEFLKYINTHTPVQVEKDQNGYIYITVPPTQVVVIPRHSNEDGEE